MDLVQDVQAEPVGEAGGDVVGGGPVVVVAAAVAVAA